MRIDNRRVNAQVNIESTDIITGFTILIVGDVPGWVYWDFDRNEYGTIDPRIVAARIAGLIKECPINILRFGIVRMSETGPAMLCPSTYKKANDNGIEIDIGELMPDKKLTISLTTGDITLA